MSKNDVFEPIETNKNKLSFKKRSFICLNFCIWNFYCYDIMSITGNYSYYLWIFQCWYFFRLRRPVSDSWESIFNFILFKTHFLFWNNRLAHITKLKQDLICKYETKNKLFSPNALHNKGLIKLSSQGAFGRLFYPYPGTSPKLLFSIRNNTAVFKRHLWVVNQYKNT